ncbi:hypothetical protein, partial [Achromobacter xylosoxidans]
MSPTRQAVLCRAPPDAFSGPFVLFSPRSSLLNECKEQDMFNRNSLVAALSAVGMLSLSGAALAQQ